VAHVVWYGDGKPEGFRLRVADWLGGTKPVLYSPYLEAPVSPAADNGWIALPPTFGRYAALRLA